MADHRPSEIRKVKLELLRSGPAHNQLLSPLTNYIALCGSDGPVTLQMPFEHRQLLMRLQRLRYPQDKDPATDDQRQSEVRDIGEAIGRVLGQVPALLSELGNAGAENSKLVHLRLVMSAFELGLIPFEAAVAPDGFPGSGSPLFLQMRAPISITREIRRGRPLPVDWNRPPRILFAFAAPGNLYVPAQTHLQALREAIEPWVRIKDENRIEEVKKLLTVLPNATLEQIRLLCASTEFTHVHILAHGAPFKYSGDERYGIALCSETGATADIVDGERLAIALTSRDTAGNTRFRPTLVTLATCDSGNINSVLTPGGSIAHELNAAGIPWVIASQFPLWMKASAIAAKVLYSGLLNGADPRWVLYELRQRLRTDSPETHDWASIVAYSTVPWDFEQQLRLFRDKQIQRKIEVKFDRIDELVGANEERSASAGHVFSDAHSKELATLCTSVRKDLESWCAESCATLSDKDRARRLGLRAASEKRIGIAYTLAKEHSLAMKAYETCRDLYRDAWEVDICNYWVITQYLSIIAILKRGDDGPALKDLADKYGILWNAAKQIVEWQIRRSSGEERAYAFSTLAELSLLGVIYGGQDINRKTLKAAITHSCQEMLNELCSDAFPIVSTRRQFRRYLKDWSSPLWENLAQAALDALTEEY
ncbi:CHAT domain-containing protein [Methylobacter sp. YRD-M1]|uniref:CHAT domain-containing protein n=1 Tax=Methylobacter sp. YRD-M1 TaxID=2911520 RepID=UPI00227B3833|nr:CHAT domain-containing protein [Methylobacter sp. YRD-M1]WAK02553.1 CHAT domain-containing protein [Methylobacter sp. YRD-M1]